MDKDETEKVVEAVIRDTRGDREEAQATVDLLTPKPDLQPMYHI